MVKKTLQNAYLILILTLSLSTFSQSTDLVRVEYLRIPENDTGIQTSRYKFLLNAPIKVNTNNYLVIGAEYNQFDVDYSRELPFDKSELQKFHIIDMNLGYITKWNENWRFIGILTPRFASNFTNGIISDDFFFNATATLWKEKKNVEKPFRIVLGLSFNSTTGLPIPLPLVSYYKRFHPNWSYTLGIPKMNFKYHPNKKNTIQMALLLDGYFINVQDDIELPDNMVGSKISLSALVGIVGYQYNITKMMSLYVLGGRSFIQEGILRNDRRDRTFLLNSEANFYLRTGFKISIF
ncbi:DUF6268 family outer membrane beta-barrel protein [Croceitalea rosinachiae]|uniref:DUF6268 family outer membrane beta-barrel protein n=1 Tax=Croceitalea rosinachiae TaxID=3075596 RepID=A0ABU3AE73_9FLAO|nr:DUF6268 family outer membrane beta-barrel protein [Croceitalea sp. F388]MDT0608205.1 DUF6268 family outer membrane beta-barrel protein [Croceitalea sp. F388]